MRAVANRSLLHFVPVAMNSSVPGRARQDTDPERTEGWKFPEACGARQQDHGGRPRQFDLAARRCRQGPLVFGVGEDIKARRGCEKPGQRSFVSDVFSDSRRTLRWREAAEARAEAQTAGEQDLHSRQPVRCESRELVEARKKRRNQQDVEIEPADGGRTLPDRSIHEIRDRRVVKIDCLGDR